MSTHPWQTDRLDLGGYLKRVGVPAREASRAALAELHEAHVRAFTFDNIDVLLGRHPGVSLEAVQQKFVTRGGAATASSTPRSLRLVDGAEDDYLAGWRSTRLGEAAHRRPLAVPWRGAGRGWRRIRASRRGRENRRDPCPARVNRALAVTFSARARWAT